VPKVSLPKPYWTDGKRTIFLGDCKDLLPLLGQFDLLLTDPPYGLECFRKSTGKSTNKNSRIKNRGDGGFNNNPPDATWLTTLLATAPLAIIWGMNNLPLPTTEYFLVWDKKQTVDNFASAELAWSNIPTPAKIFHFGIHQHNHSKRGGHPTEKPVGLMRWCIELAGNVKTIVDPYAGSGSTGVAAKDLGCQAVLIDCNEAFCEIAARRMAAQRGPTGFFKRTPRERKHEQPQETGFGFRR